MMDETRMTAQDTSVGADEGQPLNQAESSIADGEDDYKEFLRKMRETERLLDPSYLHTFSMNDLYDQTFTGRPPLIDGLLPTGTYFVAGAPKVGKSFFVAQVAYHVSTGAPLWEHPVRQGGVLYLALEDDKQRLQERMSRMFGVEGTDDLSFAIYSGQVGAGLETQLDNYLREHPGTRLVIIDTAESLMGSHIVLYHSESNRYYSFNTKRAGFCQSAISLLHRFQLVHRYIHHRKPLTLSERHSYLKKGFVTILQRKNENQGPGRYHVGELSSVLPKLQSCNESQFRKTEYGVERRSR